MNAVWVWVALIGILVVAAAIGMLYWYQYRRSQHAVAQHRRNMFTTTTGRRRRSVAQAATRVFTAPQPPAQAKASLQLSSISTSPALRKHQRRVLPLDKYLSADTPSF